MDDVFMHGSCLVCQTKIAHEDAKKKHKVDQKHVNKVAVHNFVKTDVPQMTKSTDGRSVFHERCAQRGCSILGLECLYELKFPWNPSPLWICALCFTAGDSLNAFDNHMDSDQHKNTFMNEYGEDTGLMMPECFHGDEAKKVVYAKLMLKLVDHCVVDLDSTEVKLFIVEDDEEPGASPVSSAAENEAGGNTETRADVSEASDAESVQVLESDLIMKDVDKDEEVQIVESEVQILEAEGEAVGNDLRTATKVLSTAEISRQFHIQRKEKRGEAKEAVKTNHTRSPVDGSFHAKPPESGSQQKRLADVDSTAPQEKKKRVEKEANNNDFVVIDVSSDESKEPPPPEQKTNNRRRVRGKNKQNAAQGKNLVKQYSTLDPVPGSSRNCSNVLVLTSHRVSSLDNIFNKPTAGKVPAISAKPATSTTKSAPMKSIQASSKPAKPQKSEQQTKTAKVAVAKMSKSTTSSKQEERRQDSRNHVSSSSQSAKKPSQATSSSHDSHMSSSRRSRSPGRSRPRSPPGHRTRSPERGSATSKSLDSAHAEALKSSMYAHRRVIREMRHRRDLVDYLWKQGIEPIRPNDQKAICFNAAVATIPNIVGVANLHPVECYDRPTIETLFCGMCSFWSTCSVMLEKHLTSYIHRMNFLSRYYSMFYKIVKKEHDKNMKEQLLTQYVAQIWRTEGSGMMTHRLKCVLSNSALDQHWLDYSKFLSDKWKTGVKVEIIHQAAQQEAYERNSKEIVPVQNPDIVVLSPPKERPRQREIRRSRSRSRDRSSRTSPRRHREVRDRERDYGRHHDRDRERDTRRDRERDREHEYDRERDGERAREKERRHSPRRSPHREKPTLEWSILPVDLKVTPNSRDTFEALASTVTRTEAPLSEEDRQLRMICSQLGIAERDVPLARKIVQEFSQNLGSQAQGSQAKRYRSPSPTSVHLSNLRAVLHQALDLERQQYQAPPQVHQMQMPSPIQEPMPMGYRISPPLLQQPQPVQFQEQVIYQEQRISPALQFQRPPPLLQQPLPVQVQPMSQEYWQQQPQMQAVPQQIWNPAPLPNMSVPPPAVPTYGIPQQIVTYDQPPPDLYAYPPPGHHY
ncbi:hypothetical protein L596_011706 [Steinernema carpocapsae]|uniref:Uncharacterized protein n=1 Tax=Steinernema carpocapsae TaxID=34508 RepID=A0A4U5NUS7_STECR|nr:hypothetical protein L596_011706 [Steinernema carpocapsae]